MSRSPHPSIDPDSLESLPAINANVIAVVMLQYNIPAEAVQAALLDMISQEATLEFVYDRKARPLISVAGQSWEGIYGRQIREAIDKSVKYEVSSLDPDIILNEHPNIIRGDVVHLYSDEEYRNQGCYIWDGIGTVEFFREIDDYGSLPSEFTLNEFHDPDYFNNSVNHNRIRWLRFAADEATSFKPGKSFVVTLLDANRKRYRYVVSLKDRAYSTAEELLEELGTPTPVSENPYPYEDKVLRLKTYKILQ